MATIKAIEVESYSGTRYAEEPRVVVQSGERVQVVSVVRRWREPDGLWFEVELSDGMTCTLFYDEAQDRWYERTDAPKT